MSQLYLIATPLGNRDDITLRALATLRSLEHLFAEDTRELHKLLEMHGVPRSGKRIASLASHNMKESVARALSILHEGHCVGFVSDRGTPSLSDPGAMLARAALDAGVAVIPIPGPSSLTAALSVAGIPADRFVFLGFLPPTTSEREALWEWAASGGIPIAFFESPKRVRKTLRELKGRFPAGGDVFVAREMTKAFESYSLSRLETLDEEGIPEVGEFVIVLGLVPPPPRPGAWKEEVRLRLAPDKAWAKAVAARHGVTARDVYNALHHARK